MLPLLLATTDVWESHGLFWIVVGVITIVAIFAATITSVFKVRARERTKREIAAYVAEGSIDPNDAVAMLKAGSKVDASEDEG